MEPVDEKTVTVNITDTLTSVHVGGKQLTIRDIFKKDLKYKISYYKSGSTGKVQYCSFEIMVRYHILYIYTTVQKFGVT